MMQFRQWLPTAALVAVALVAAGCGAAGTAVAPSAAAGPPVGPQQYVRPASLALWGDEGLTRPAGALERGTRVVVVAGLQQSRSETGRLRSRFGRVAQVVAPDGQRGWLRPCVVYEAGVQGGAAERNVECLLQTDAVDPLEADYEAMRQFVREPTLRRAALQRAEDAAGADAAAVAAAGEAYRASLGPFCDARGGFVAVHGEAGWEGFEFWLEAMMTTRSSRVDQQLVRSFLDRARADCVLQLR